MEKRNSGTRVLVELALVVGKLVSGGRTQDQRVGTEIQVVSLSGAAYDLTVNSLSGKIVESFAARLSIALLSILSFLLVSGTIANTIPRVIAMTERTMIPPIVHHFSRRVIGSFSPFGPRPRAKPQHPPVGQKERPRQSPPRRSRFSKFLRETSVETAAL